MYNFVCIQEWKIRVNYTIHSETARAPPLKYARTAVFLAPSASQSATTLPGVHNVRAYASAPTRDNRLLEAARATKARADQARRIATKAQRDQKLMLAVAMAAKGGHSFKVFLYLRVRYRYIEVSIDDAKRALA